MNPLPFLTRARAKHRMMIYGVVSLLVIGSMLLRPVMAIAVIHKAEYELAVATAARFAPLDRSAVAPVLKVNRTEAMYVMDRLRIAAALPAPAMRTLAQVNPTPSNARPAYPHNHLLDGIVPQIVGTPPVNYDFEATATGGGVPPANYDFSTVPYSVGTPPPNHDFESGTFSNWTTAGTVTMQSDSTHGYWAQMEASGVLTSDPFTVDGSAQRIFFALNHLASAGARVYLLSGPTYSTRTSVGTFTCSSCGWVEYSLDPAAYVGQSVKIEFQRSGNGNIGVDAVAMDVALPEYTTSGLIGRLVAGDGNAYARLGRSGVMTSAPFTIGVGVQQMTLLLTGLTNYSDQYRVELLSDPSFGTVTQLGSGTVSDSWQQFAYNVSAWQGQAVKLRISSIYFLGAIGIDELGLQSITIPNWSVTGATTVVDEGNGNHYVSTNGTLTSDPFVLDPTVQQITLRYRVADGAGDSFYLKLLRGANFSEEIDLVGNQHGTTEWQTLKVALNLYAGETVKIKLQRYFGRIFFDDVALGEIVLPGWQPTATAAIAGASDNYGSYITAASGGAISIRSVPIETGIIDHPYRVDARYYAVAYAIGDTTGSLLRVYWVNEQGQQYTVMQDAANSPTGYRERYFPIHQGLGTSGYFIVNVTGGGKVYSIADNIARQHLNEPFSYKVGIQVDTATGAFGYQAQDLQVAGSTPLVFTRYYNGHSDRLGVMGYGWSHSYETRLVVTDDDDAGVVFGAGKEIFFIWNSSSQTFSPADARVYDELVKNGDGSYTYTTKANQRYNFSAAGVLQTIQDPNNNTVTLAYDGNGRLGTVTAQGGATLTLGYDGNGRLSTVADPLTATTTYIYDGNGDLINVARPDAGIEQYSYSSHRLSQVVDATGHTLFQNSFDSIHRVVQQSDALGKSLTIQYSTPAAGVTTVTDPEGGVTAYYFDKYQRTTDWVAPTAAVTSYLYDNVGNLDKVIDGGAGQWDFGYDNSGNLLSSQDPLGNPLQITYNPEHLPTSITDGNGHVTTMVYDANGNVLQQTDPLGNVTAYTYNSNGNMTSMTNALGHTETYTYDNAGNRLTRTDPLGNTWIWTYDGAGRMKTETDPLNHTTTYSYDLFGRRTRVQDHLGNQKKYFYDLVGRLLASDDELNRRTQWGYDDRGLAITKTDPAGKVTTYTYNDNRQMTSAIDPLGQTTAYEYDADNRLIKIIKPGGSATQYSYDGNGRLATETDALGRVTSYSYDSAGKLAGSTQANGATTLYSYDGNGNLTQKIDPLGRITAYAYDNANRRTTMTSAGGFVTTYSYDATGRQVQETDPLGATRTQSYNAAGQLVATTDPLGHTTTYAYDAAGKQISTTDPLNRTETTGYDAVNRMASTTDSAGNTTQYGYDVAGQLTQITEATGAVTSYLYDARGLKTSETDALNNTTTYSYDDAGRMIQSTNPLGQSTSYSFNAAGRLASMTDALGNTTTFTYDTVGNRTASTDPLGRTKSTTYDLLNRPIAETDAGGNTTQSSYDLAGQLLQMTTPTASTTNYGYNSRGLLTSVTNALGQGELYEYDAAGRRTKSTDRRGYDTLFTYDAAGRTQSMMDAMGGTVQFGYDAVGQVTTLTNPLGKQSTYTYDLFGNKLTQTDPLGRTRTYTYDQYGRIAAKTDARGVGVSYSYDLLDRLTSVSYPGGSNSYSYNATGDITSVTDPTGTTNFTHDALARVTAIAAPQGTVAYTYDAAGQRSTMTLPNNRTVSYTYHPTGNLATITDWLSGVQSFNYNADGNLLQVTRPNSVNSNYSYDAAGRLTAVSHDGSGGNIQSFSYTLDPNGNRIAVAMPGGTESYTLDPLNRLTGVTYANGDSAGYSYDALGNQLSETFNGTTTSYSYDDAGQLLTDGTINFTYDANGNLTAAGTDIYTWDWADRLVAATVAGNNVSYSYDAFDVRVGTTVNGVSSSYLWDRQATYPQLVDDGSFAYLHNNGPLAQIDGGGNRTYLLTDALHSVRGMVDGAGALVGTTEYAAFGALRSQTGMTSSMGFTGELFSAATGLLHLRARDLMPTLGRFLSVDTVQPNAPGTMGYNLYAYAANNPTTWVDPSGHFYIPPEGWAYVLAIFTTLSTIGGGGLVGLALMILAILLVLALILSIILAILSGLPNPGGGIGPGPADSPQGDPTQEPPKPTPTPDDEDRRRVFISGGNHPYVTSHISTAIYFDAPTKLHKIEGRVDESSWWYYQRNQFDYQSPYDPPLVGNRCWKYGGIAQVLNIACDEYPFGSTREGGEENKPSLEPLDATDNSSHGRALKSFYALCHVHPEDGRGGEFEVVIDRNGLTRPHCPEYGIDGGLGEP